ncbi:MAG: transposase [Planctomycetes bacterium]|nr:transposase [Planctomycetota bacterium]
MKNKNDTAHLALFIVACAGSMNQKLHQLIEFQNEQIRVLKKLNLSKEKLSNDDRRRLSRLAHDIETKMLKLSETIVTISTIREWYRKLIAKKYTAGKAGRPPVSEEVEKLVVRLAEENPFWGEDLIADRMKELGYKIHDRTVGRILRRNGIPPAPEREKTGTWEQFLRTNFPDVCAIDFVDTEVLNTDGTLTRYRALYCIHLESREAQLMGLAEIPDGNWSENIARHMADPFDGFLTGKKFCIMDRDPLFTKVFRMILKSEDIRSIRLPAKTPNMNAYMERFIGTVRRELSPDFIPLSEEHLRHAITEHLQYYNHERNHQGLKGNVIPFPKEDCKENTGEIIRKSRLDGRLNYYSRAAS